MTNGLDVSVLAGLWRGPEATSAGDNLVLKPGPTATTTIIVKRRGIEPIPTAGDQAVSYIRVGGASSARICYRRAGAGRPTRHINAKADAKIARLAYMVCTLAPDAVDEVLAMPSRRLGRLVKAALRRAKKTSRKRGHFRRRPRSQVLRILAVYP